MATARPDRDARPPARIGTRVRDPAVHRRRPRRSRRTPRRRRITPAAGASGDVCAAGRTPGVSGGCSCVGVPASGRSERERARRPSDRDRDARRGWRRNTRQGGRARCPASVDYQVLSQWVFGFTAQVTIINTGTAAINGWTLRFDLAAGQNVGGGWNGQWQQDGTSVTVARRVLQPVGAGRRIGHARVPRDAARQHRRARPASSR